MDQAEKQTRRKQALGVRWRHVPSADTLWFPPHCEPTETCRDSAEQQNDHSFTPIRAENRETRDPHAGLPAAHTHWWWLASCGLGNSWKWSVGSDKMSKRPLLKQMTGRAVSPLEVGGACQRMSSWAGLLHLLLWQADLFTPGPLRAFVYLNLQIHNIQYEWVNEKLL